MLDVRREVDLHCELVQDLQTLRRQNAALRQQLDAIQHVLAVDEIRYNRQMIESPKPAGLEMVATAIEQQTAMQRALKTMRVFHYEFTIPKERCPKCGWQPPPPKLPEPTVNPDYVALRVAADLADSD